jgi:hypothetical protein
MGMEEICCPHGGRTKGKRKIGCTESGGQHKYTPTPKARGYVAALRQLERQAKDNALAV